jgi:hypothetical protein
MARIALPRSGRFTALLLGLQVLSASGLEGQAPMQVVILPEAQPRDSVGAADVEGFANRIAGRLNRLTRVRFVARVASTALARELNLESTYLAAVRDGRMVDLTDPLTRALPGMSVVRILSREVDAARRLTVQVSDSTGQRGEREFESPAPLDDQAAEQIADYLEVVLGLSIRIAIMNFRMVGGDSVRFGGLTDGLPHMVAEGLKLSSRIVLVESVNRDSLLSATVRGLDGFMRPSTMVAANRFLNANYFVMGEFWELEGKLRLSIRCVAMESGEIIATRGLVVSGVDVDSINAQVGRLTVDLREAIELDYSQREPPPRYLAVSGYPPYPENGENRAILLELTRTISRKIRVAAGSDLRVRENPEAVARHTLDRFDSWTLSDQLGSDVVVVLDLDRVDRDQWVLNVEYFDRQNPRVAETFPPFVVPIQNVDSVLNEIVPLIMKKVSADPLDSAAVQRFTAVAYRGPNRVDGVRYGFGGAVHADPELFLNTDVALTFSAGYVLNPVRAEHWQFELFRSRLALLGSRTRGKALIGGLDVMIGTGVYRLRPWSSFSPYVALSGGFLGVGRLSSWDLQIDGKPGIGLSVGFERVLGSGQRQRVEVELTRAFGKVGSYLLGGSEFAGGTPGGLFFTVYREP